MRRASAPPGDTGDDVRLLQSYDLRAGRMVQVQVTDRHTAEGLGHFTFQAGDTVMTDAGLSPRLWGLAPTAPDRNGRQRGQGHHHETVAIGRVAQAIVGD